MNFLLQELSTADRRELLQKPEQTPGLLIYLQPWLPPDILSDQFYFFPCRCTPRPHSSPASRKALPLPRLHGCAAVYGGSGQWRKEQVKLEPENDTGVWPPFWLYSGPFASISRPGIRYLDSMIYCDLPDDFRSGALDMSTWTKICRHLKHDVGFASVMNKGVFRFFNVVFSWPVRTFLRSSTDFTNVQHWPSYSANGNANSFTVVFKFVFELFFILLSLKKKKKIRNRVLYCIL